MTSVAVPALTLSRLPSGASPIDPAAFQTVQVGDSSGSAMTPLSLDVNDRSDGFLGDASVLGDPMVASNPAPRPATDQPEAKASVVVLNTWRRDADVSWYGPGFYGNRTACGVVLTTSVIGVANRTLPCGTLVTFKNPANGRVVTAPVIDRGPYVSGRQWDLTGGLCLALAHCYTGTILWKLK